MCITMIWYLQRISEVWGFESPSGRGIFCLKNFDTFIRSSVRVSKMNAVARARFTYQMLTLFQISIPPEPVFKNMGQQISGPDNSLG